MKIGKSTGGGDVGSGVGDVFSPIAVRKSRRLSYKEDRTKQRQKERQREREKQGMWRESKTGCTLWPLAVRVSERK